VRPALFGVHVPDPGRLCPVMADGQVIVSLMADGMDVSGRI